MESSVADQIIHLAAKWQCSSQWAKAVKAGAEFLKYSDLLATLIYDGSREGYANSQRWGDCCLKLRKQITDLHQELIDLKNLVRQHVPQLLEYVPDVDFFEEAKHSRQQRDRGRLVADHSQQQKDLSKLEGAVRVLLVGTTQADDPTKPQKRSSKGTKPFTDAQLDAVRGVIQNKPTMKMSDIKAQLANAGGTGIGNDKLQKILDHIRKSHPGEYTTPIRQRRKKS